MKWVLNMSSEVLLNGSELTVSWHSRFVVSVGWQDVIFSEYSLKISIEFGYLQ